MIKHTVLFIVALGAIAWLVSGDFFREPLQQPNLSSTRDSTATIPTADSQATPLSSSEQSRQVGLEPPAAAIIDLKPGDIVYQRGDFVERRLVVTECYPETLSAYTDEGLVTMAVPRCEKELRYLHPYGDLDRSSLTKLAEYDGAAALILAEKLAAERPNDDRVTRLFIHAFALSNEPQVFEALFDYAAGHGLVYENGELDKARAANSYVWSRIGDRAGFRDISDVDAYREALVEAGASIDALDQTVERIASLINSESTKFNGEALL